MQTGVSGDIPVSTHVMAVRCVNEIYSIECHGNKSVVVHVSASQENDLASIKWLHYDFNSDSFKKQDFVIVKGNT